MDVKLVEAQDPAIAQQLVQRGRQRIRVVAMTEHALVQAGEKLMKVQALFFRDGQGLEKTVEQPALSATDGAMQVKPRQWFR